MAKKGQKKKAQKALKKRTQKKQAVKQQRTLKGSTSIRKARGYPLEGCWTQEDWQEGGLAVVVVARRQPDGNIIIGNYLVDYYCLGVKNAFYEEGIPASEFHRSVISQAVGPAGDPVEISPALAHELIYGSVEYAAQFGFRPHRDFNKAKLLLDPPDMHPPTGSVEFGKDGKPFYMSGPYDNAEAIIDKLSRTAGDGNFHYLLGPDAMGMDDWDEGEEEPEEMLLALEPAGDGTWVSEDGKKWTLVEEDDMVVALRDEDGEEWRLAGEDEPEVPEKKPGSFLRRLFKK